MNPDDLRHFSGTTVYLGAAPEIKALVASKNLLEELLISGLIEEKSPVFIKSALWLMELKDLGIDKDLLSKDVSDGEKYRDFLGSTVSKFSSWISELQSDEPGPVTDIFAAYSELFAAKLMEVLGFLRCVYERTDQAKFEYIGELDGAGFYVAMLDEEDDWQEQKAVLESLYDRI